MNFGKYFGLGFMMILIMKVLIGPSIFPILSSYKSNAIDWSWILIGYGILDFILEIIGLMIVYKSFYEDRPRWYYGPILTPIILSLIVNISMLFLFINSGF